MASAFESGTVVDCIRCSIVCKHSRLTDCAHRVWCGPCCCRCRYGLLGLLHVIRMTEPDLTMLALGTDLTGLGLNLNSPDPLYKVSRHCHAR